MTRISEWWYLTRRFLLSSLAFLSMRVFGFGVPFQDVWHETYTTAKHIDRNLDSAQDLDQLLTIAKDIFKAESDSRAIITDKAKTLLTLSSLLLGLVGILLPKQLGFDAGWMQALLLIAILALLNTVALLLAFFGTRPEMALTLDQDEIGLSKDDLKKNFINLNLRCAVYAENRTAYLSDLFKTLRFFFLMAFSIIAFLFCFNFFSGSESRQTEQLVQALRADPKLLDLLRGPKGDKGSQGKKGDKGSQGEKGEAGRADAVEILNELVKRKDFKELIKAELGKHHPPEQPPASTKKH